MTARAVRPRAAVVKPVSVLLALDEAFEVARAVRDQKTGEAISGFASLFEISMWRGTASTAPVFGLHHREWDRPSRFK